MKKITTLKLILSLFLFLGFAFGQSDENKQENALEFIDQFSDYINSTPIYSADEDFEEKLFDAMKKSIFITKDYLNSLKFKMENVKNSADDIYNRSGIEHFTISSFEKNYYEAVQNEISFNFFLIKSINFLERINDVYEQEADFINASLGFNSIRNTIYELKYLLAIVYYYQGSYKNLKKSIHTFEDILGDNKNKISYAFSKEERRLTYSFLVSAFDLLINLKHASITNLDVASYKREKLYYLWQLVTTLYEDNEALRILKLTRLTKESFSVMDKESDRFRELYAPFIIANGVLVSDEDS